MQLEAARHAPLRQAREHQHDRAARAGDRAV